MGVFLRKDIMVLVRDRTEMLILLAMPFILTAILGFALGGILDGDTEVLNMQIAVVNEDDEAAGVAELEEALGGRGLPDGTEAGMLAAARELRPLQMLEGLLQSEDLEGFVTMVEMDGPSSEHALRGEEVAAVLTIPQNFTGAFLQKALLGEGGGSELQLTISDSASTQSDVFYAILDEFTRVVNFETALSQVAAEEGMTIEVPDTQLGGIESITAAEPLTSLQYYSLGMAVMFSLFVASAIAYKSYIERKQHVFDRIILSNRHPLIYLGGKAISAAILTFGQLFLLFGLGELLFQTFDLADWRMWAGMAVVSGVLAICIGAVATVLTSLTLRFNSETVTTIFSAGLVTLFAFLGGSFIPTDGMPAIVSTLGGWTPNGAALTAFLLWMQHMDYSMLVEPLGRILIIAALSLAVGLMLFPKRRGDVA